MRRGPGQKKNVRVFVSSTLCDELDVAIGPVAIRSRSSAEPPAAFARVREALLAMTGA